MKQTRQRGKRQRQQSQELIEARRCIDEWRRKSGGGTGTRIPDHVWAAAVAAARVDGVCATAVALRMQFRRLKKRAGLANRQLVRRDSVGPAFVEMEITPVRAVASRPNGKAEAVIELLGRDGERMRVEMASLAEVDLVGLSQTFWSRQP